MLKEMATKTLTHLSALNARFGKYFGLAGCELCEDVCIGYVICCCIYIFSREDREFHHSYNFTTPAKTTRSGVKTISLSTYFRYFNAF